MSTSIIEDINVFIKGAFGESLFNLIKKYDGTELFHNTILLGLEALYDSKTSDELNDIVGNMFLCGKSILIIKKQGQLLKMSPSDQQYISNVSKFISASHRIIQFSFNKINKRIIEKELINGVNGTNRELNDTFLILIMQTEFAMCLHDLDSNDNFYLIVVDKWHDYFRSHEQNEAIIRRLKENNIIIEKIEIDKQEFFIDTVLYFNIFFEKFKNEFRPSDIELALYKFREIGR